MYPLLEFIAFGSWTIISRDVATLKPHFHGSGRIGPCLGPPRFTLELQLLRMTKSLWIFLEVQYLTALIQIILNHKFICVSGNICSGLVLRSVGTNWRHSDEGETSLYAANIRDLGNWNAPIIKWVSLTASTSTVSRLQSLGTTSCRFHKQCVALDKGLLEYGNRWWSRQSKTPFFKKSDRRTPSAPATIERI